MIFEKIQNIDLNDKSTWEEKIFLTFDVDWASDEVLDYCLKTIKKYEIRTTFFLTHKTRLLGRLKADKDIESGLHPNFNPLLNGDFEYGRNIVEVLGFFKDVVPEAVSVKSHSVTQSAHILEIFGKSGLKYECNSFIPFSARMELRPWLHLDGELIRVPLFWEDDVCCLDQFDCNVDSLLRRKGIKVFGFHPIHVFLNTKTLETYYEAKEYLYDFNKLGKHINKNTYGTRDFLMELVEKALNYNL
jgi:hypothetical protein